MVCCFVINKSVLAIIFNFVTTFLAIYSSKMGNYNIG